VTMEASIRAIDSRVPSVARIYDYLLGGSTHFEVDRQTCDRVATEYPGGLEAGRANVRANRRFLGRAVRYLVRDAGIRQFLDVGSGLPNDGNVHTVAQGIVPEARVVYVDNDTVVLAHAQDMLRGGPEGATTFLYEDLRNVDDVIAQAGETLDFTRPVGVMLVSVLHAITDDQDPAAVVAGLIDAVAPGSFLVMTHMSSEIAPETAKFLERLNAFLPEPMIDRSNAEIAGFFEGLELIEPGMVPIDQWRPKGKTPAVPGGRTPPYYGVMGRKR
jgi:SAM-dependent methyltransferase